VALLNAFDTMPKLLIFWLNAVVLTQ